MNKINVKIQALNVLFGLFAILLLYRLFYDFFTPYDYGSHGISSFLINYHGGFVRRGLIGEILFFFAENFNIHVEWTIKIICLLAFVLVSFFFVRQFLKKSYSLYILPLCFFLGGAILDGYWVRKDLLFFCFFIPVIWLYNKNNIPVFVKMLFINILAVFIILNHEVFAFFALPVLYLLFFNQFKIKGFLRSSVLSFLFL
ncbi:MAG: hypothetical protein LBS25_01365, partial [Candidatus Symbiothrix sp.]|nr:hypothetical protein [Candidatus Symbiothrix sp.]